jgi:predicted secreted protein
VTSHQSLRTAYDDGGVREFKIVLTDSGSAEIHFNGILTNFPVNGPFDDKVTLSLTVAITGKTWIVY